MLGADSLSITRPRSAPTRASRPRIARAAVAPRQTTSAGASAFSSPSSQRLQASKLALRGCLVDPSLATGRPLEVLDCIGHVDRAPVQARRDERPIEETSGRADERPSDAVFDVAGLLPNQHDAAVRIAFAKYGLRRAAP